MAVPVGFPAEIDISRPSIARVYDAGLAGKDNHPLDRAVNEEARRISPAAVDSARVNRDPLIRGIRHLAESGIDPFLDLGAGLPTVRNTHEVARSANPDARVVSVDNDPVVVVHA
jgi:hypothetical protein